MMPHAPARQLRRAARVSLLAYLFAGAFPVLVVIAHDDIWKHSLSAPISYAGGDTLGVLAGAKNLIDSSWSYHARFLGAPGEADYYDYPQSDVINTLLLKILACVTGNAVAGVTLFYLVSFPLCACSALWALRRMGISTPAAAVCAALYALLHYHFYRGVLHLYLSNYALIPPVVLIAAQLASGISFDGDPDAARRRRWAMFIVAATLCAGVYYGFFGVFTIVIGGLLGAAAKRSWEPIKSAGILAMVAAIVLVLNVAPTMWYVYRNGTNTDAAARSPVEAEVFALRLTYLLLPADHHRLGVLGAITGRYDQQVSDEVRSMVSSQGNAQKVYTIESRSEALGFLATIGFLVLLAIPLLAAARPAPSPSHSVRLEEPGSATQPVALFILAAFNLACILLATTGAAGSLVAVFVSPLIRSYDRICVVIAFLSLAAVGMLIDRFILQPLESGGRGAVGLLILAGVLIAATLDQVPRAPQGREQQLADFGRDQAFVQNIERSVPAGSMIFQLPYVSFPEAGYVGRIQDYDPFRGYIHSTNLRWSYGTMRGRPQDAIDQKLAALPPGELIPRLGKLGFAGIWIDLYGYDPAAWPALESAFASAAGSPALHSTDAEHRFLFFTIAP